MDFGSKAALLGRNANSASKRHWQKLYFSCAGLEDVEYLK